MGIQRSANCRKYTDTISTLVEAKVYVPGNESMCNAEVSSFSCQTSAFEKPDTITRNTLLAKGKAQLAIQPQCAQGPFELEATTTLVGARDVEYSPTKLKQLGMTSNCYMAGNDSNQATHIARAQCYPMETMTDSQGRRVKNTNMSFLSNLATCDISDEAFPQVQEDLRKVAAHNAMENGYTIDKPEDLACTFSVLPHL